MTISELKILLSKAKIFFLIKTTSFYDYVLYKFRIEVPVTIQEGKTIVYLGSNLPPRIARIVKWLKRSEDYHLILICQKDGFNQKFSNEYFDNIVLFRNKWHLLRILSTIKKPKLIHAFGPKSYYPDIAREFMKGTKFIYDMQDVLITYYGNEPGIGWFYDEFPHEKNCLELSDGIVSHGLEPIAGFKLYKIKKNKTLFFPLYCDDDFFQANNKSLNKDDIHIVYAGEIQGKDRDKKQFGNVQFHDLIESFSQQKLHLHLYPSPATSPLYYEEYRNIAKSNTYFHLHTPVAQNELPRELAKYHFGLIAFFKENTNLSDYKNRYSTSLKLFNFIEAGIPIIISKDITFQCWMAERYKAAIPIEKKDISFLRDIIEKVDYHQMTELLLKNRQLLSLKSNIYRLSDFYNTFN